MGLSRAGGIALAMLLLSLVAPFAPASSAQELAPSPEVSAQAAYVFDATQNVELLAENSDSRRAPASTVKIVTAMVVLDHAELSTEIVFDEADTATADESRMGLVGGDMVTVQQLLVGLLLPSGNDAARTLARHVGEILLEGAGGGDPIERFVDEMNAKVAAAGLVNSNFTSPDGLNDDENEYTTAYDLAHLGALAMGYDTIADTVSQSTAEITSIGPEARPYALRNTNLFLPDSGTEFATEDVIGLKSGSTSRAGANLVIAKRERGGNLVIAVVMGSDLAYDDQGMISVDGRWEDMRAILRSIGDAFAWLNPESNNDVPGLKDEMAAWQVQLEDDSAILVSQELRRSIRYQLELLPEAPSKSAAGRVLFFAGPDLITERPLIFR